MFKLITKQIFLTTLFIGMVPSLVLAENITVSPLIIDHETEARDILTKDITLKNNDSNHVRLFASVHEIEMSGNNEIKSFVPSSMSDRTTSVTSWIEITRGRIDMQGGTETSVPLTIRINPNAKPGDYHAFVGFASGSNRDEAEKKILAGQSMGVIIRVSITEKQVELLRLTNFKSDQIVYEDGHNFTFTLENNGDLPQTPQGEIIIYDSRGVELSAVKVNEENVVINPSEKIDFSEPIPFTDRFGKNKAHLSISYGQNNLTNIYDINFYYSIPWLYLLIIGTIFILTPVILTWLFRRMSRQNDYYEFDHNEAVDLPLFVKKSHEHETHDHDINLRKNDS